MYINGAANRHDFYNYFQKQIPYSLRVSPSPIQLQIMGAHLMAKTYGKEANKSPTKAIVSAGKYALFWCVTKHLMVIPYRRFGTVTTI
jgi:uncharacterized protein (DUF697 family)